MEDINERTHHVAFEAVREACLQPLSRCTTANLIGLSVASGAAVLPRSRSRLCACDLNYGREHKSYNRSQARRAGKNVAQEGSPG
jgi:hypothetical protein